ncbi:hypothetical protein HX785_07395 [Pseudomonas reactans]|uniref:hypothetical protein n=1 Tax=Pseudomonas reactans TaxID=117680 RepID=UPI0015A4A6FC|nr:hypothetical protein [Pseudomonas reactans]NWF13505.1 hypothetical protein [Pseudomonas reactans]
MTEELDRKDQLGLSRLEAADKLDYFMLGMTLAICAYLAQTNPYAPVEINKETFLLLSLLIFAGSAFFGFLRLEVTEKVLSANLRALEAHEKDETQKAESHLAKAGDYIRKAKTYYKIRNLLLFAGLICYIGTKVWATYQNNGWIPVH